MCIYPNKEDMPKLSYFHIKSNHSNSDLPSTQNTINLEDLVERPST